MARLTFDNYYDDYLSWLGRERESRMESRRQVHDDLLDPGNTVAGFAFDYGRKVSDMSVLANTDYEAFASAYDELERTIQANAGGLGALVDGGARAARSDGLVRRAVVGASQALEFAHRNRTVKLDDGSEVTWQQLRAHPEMYSQRQTYGFSKETMDAYNGKATLPDGSPDYAARTVLSPFVEPVVGAARAGDIRNAAGDSAFASNRLQLNDAAHFATKNLRAFRQAYGDDGARYLFSWVARTLDNAGGMREMLSSALEYAKARGGSDDGYRAAADFTNAMNQILDQTFKRPGRDANIDPSEKRWMVSAVTKALSGSGEQIDLSSDGARAAIVRAADVYAKYRGMGMDVATSVGGKAMSDAVGRYVREYSKTGVEPVDNLVTRLRSLHETLTRRFVGSDADRQLDSQPTGDASAYRNNVARRLGRESSSASASAIAAAVVENTEKALLPFMSRGANERDAMKALASDQAEYGRYVNAVTQGILEAGGFDRPETAQYLVGLVTRAFEKSGRFDVVQAVEQHAFSEILERRSPEVARDLRDWYVTNVSGADMFADVTPRLMSHFMSKYGGMNQMQAIASVERLKRLAKAEALKADGSAAAVKDLFNRALRTGKHLRQTGWYWGVDGKGGLTRVDESTATTASPSADGAVTREVKPGYVAEVAQFYGDMGFDPADDASRVRFEEHQATLARRYLNLQNMLNAASRKAGSSWGADEDQDFRC